jgi:hypothetical protein
MSAHGSTSHCRDLAAPPQPQFYVRREDETANNPENLNQACSPPSSTTWGLAAPLPPPRSATVDLLSIYLVGRAAPFARVPRNRVSVNSSFKGHERHPTCSSLLAPTIFTHLIGNTREVTFLFPPKTSKVSLPNLLIFSTILFPFIYETFWTIYS